MVSFNDAVNYVLFKNPVSRFTIDGAGQLAKATGLQSKSVTPNRAIASKALADVTIPLSKLVASNYWLIRIAGISGAAAVCLAAYGRHGFKNAGKNQEYLHIYESANQMHFIHSIALVTAPLTKRPLITGSLFITGMLLFSGTCYYKAIKKSRGEDVEYLPAQLAPYGGACLILGWLSMIF